MLFHSANFLFLFLPVALLGYFLVKRLGDVWGKLWVIGASVVFYASWRVEFVPLMAFSIVFNYLVAELLFRMKPAQPRGLLLTFGVLVNVGLLGYFKYKNFFLENLSAVTGWEFAQDNVALPLAISFYTFTQIAYTTDVYRKADKRRSVLDYCMFIMFFPHLVAGPILRHWEFFPQIQKGLPRVLARHVFPGLMLLFLGIAKKILFAETAAGISDPIFNSPPGTITFFEAWAGAVAFAMQVYFDFSAYSDMALGLGLLFGIRLPVNFLSPFKATNIIDFWSCWHITLGRFLRDYIYIPLSRIMRDHWKLPLDKANASLVRGMLSIFATMIVSGVWHGAGWPYIFFGFWNGIGLAMIHASRKFFGVNKNPGLPLRAFKWTVTFVFILFTFVYFRSPSMDKAHSILGAMFGGAGLSAPAYHAGTYGDLLGKVGVAFVETTLPQIGRTEVLWLAFLLAWVILLPNSFVLLRRWRPSTDRIAEKSRFILRPTWWVAVGLGLILFVILKSFFVARPSEFIYFQF
jgi:D-alanyl-lipoteichoic acid acyltransferase DltB (MBOAT superfamily)